MIRMGKTYKPLNTLDIVIHVINIKYRSPKYVVLDVMYFDKNTSTYIAMDKNRTLPLEAQSRWIEIQK